jgi:O-antigen ligase
MIRLILLFLIISGLAVYAWKDWYKSLCGLVLLMAVVEHPDMPKSMLGIQGLNPWNILLFIIVIAWASNRRKEGLYWDMPRHVNILLLLYLTIIVVGFVRMISDTSGLLNWARMTSTDEPTTAGLFSEHFLNRLKWVVPGMLMFDGCRDRKRFNYSLICILGIYFLLAVQVIKWMPLSAVASSEALSERSLKILSREVGYHRVNLSMMLAGASWAIMSTQVLADSKNKRMVIIALSFTTMFAQVLTGGRTGYATWAAVGMVLGIIRWRKYLLLIPFLILAIVLIVPSAVERFSYGFSPETRDTNVRLSESYSSSESSYDLYTITAGRNVAWPYVIEKIQEAPLWGHGTEAMQRTGITIDLWQTFGEEFPHPHNAFLQWLLDNGLIGFIPVFLFYATVIRYSISLFQNSRSPVYIAIGGVTLSLVTALLFASVGSETFYPREGNAGMWCAIGLMFRVYMERSKLLRRMRL